VDRSLDGVSGKNSRFLRSAVAVAPAPVGMTGYGEFAGAPVVVGMTRVGNKEKIKVKGSGQECPLHTGLSVQT
jgi:hypothetical protein